MSEKPKPHTIRVTLNPRRGRYEVHDEAGNEWGFSNDYPTALNKAVAEAKRVSHGGVPTIVEVQLPNGKFKVEWRPT